MRRKDREILDEKYMDQIIQACDCCRLGLQDEGAVYIVPLNFAYRRENGRPIFYFHGAREGRKIDLLKKNNLVGFELDTNHQIKTGNHACEFSFRFQSIIGAGKVVFLQEPQEKEIALQYIMQHYSGKTDWQLSGAAIEKVAVIKLIVENISCKEHD